MLFTPTATKCRGSVNMTQHEEARRQKRVPSALSGSYILETGGNHTCQIENISATGMLLRGFPRGDCGEWVVAYFNELGRVEGTVVRRTDTGFAFEMAATLGETRQVAAKIANLVATREASTVDELMTQTL